MGGGALEILFFLLIFAAILFLAYITTKIVAKNSGIRAKSKYMEVVDRLDFGTNSQLLILRVGNESFLVSKTAKGVEFLTKLGSGSSDAEARLNDGGGSDGGGAGGGGGLGGSDGGGAGRGGGLGGGESGNPAGQYEGKRDFRSMLERYLNFGVVKTETRGSVFRKNIDKIRNISSKKARAETEASGSAGKEKQETGAEAGASGSAGKEKRETGAETESGGSAGKEKQETGMEIEEGENTDRERQEKK